MAIQDHLDEDSMNIKHLNLTSDAADNVLAGIRKRSELLRGHLANKERKQRNPAARRFAVALSFPGGARHRAGAIARHLAERLGRDRVLYDQFHEAEFACPNLDVYLQCLYHDQTELNVVFLCKDYEDREWCGLEWRALRDLIKHRRQEIMLLRIDDGPVSGVFSIDGYMDINNRDDEEVAHAIVQRWTQQDSATQTQAEASNTASPNDLGTTRPLLKDAAKLPSRRTAMFDLHLDKGDRIHVALVAEHELGFAICTAVVYKRWRATARLTGSLHHARRTCNTAITIVAKDSGTHHVLVINNTKRKDSIHYTLTVEQL